MTYSPTTPRADTKIFVSTTPQIGMARQQEKSLRYGINQLVGDFDASASSCNVEPNVIEVGYSLRRYAVGH